jgi:hypothetical protein
MNDVTKCGCGRSPTGNCIGWHDLTEEEFQVKLAAYEENKRVSEKSTNSD